MTARADDLATTFRTWSASREVTLQRTAYLLTGDVPAARLRVRDALAAALATEPAGPDDLDTAALRALLAGGSATGSDLVLAHSDDVGIDPRQRVVWDYLSTLGRAERAGARARLPRVASTRAPPRRSWGSRRPRRRIAPTPPSRTSAACSTCLGSSTEALLRADARGPRRRRPAWSR